MLSFRLNYWLIWPQNEIVLLYLKIAIVFRISFRLMKWCRKFNPTLLYWATYWASNGRRKYAIWVYKYGYVVTQLNISILFRISPRLMKCYQISNPTLLHWTTAFFQKWLGGFLKKCSVIPSVRQSVSPSARQPVSPSVHQSISHFIGIFNFFWTVPRFFSNLGICI